MNTRQAASLRSKISRYYFTGAFLLAYFLMTALLRDVCAEHVYAGWRSPSAEDAELEEEREEKDSAQKKSGEISRRPAPKKAPRNPERSATSDTQLTLRYAQPSKRRHREIAAILKESEGFEDIIAAMNETYTFPHIDIAFDECDEANAYYYSEDRSITLCYELVEALADGFSQDEELTEDEIGERVIASLVFTLFHELGHAAVDVFDLPITGNEEDAVDRFATLILIESSDDELDLADSAIGSFDLETAESLEDLDFADEHPVDEQRWYTMACLMVGSDPEKYDYLVGENGLPAERAEACPEEYERISKSWKRLMKPYTK